MDEPTTRRMNLVVIDDDQDDIRFMKVALDRFCRASDLELEYRFLDSGERALNLIDTLLGDRSMPDAICVDLNMPGVSGLDVLHHCRLRDVQRTTNMFVVTTSSDDDVHRKAREFGACEVFVKPKKIADMSRLFGEVIARSGLSAKGAEFAR